VRNGTARVPLSLGEGQGEGAAPRRRC